MLDKLLREIVVLTVGKPAEPIADLLNSNKHVNEFNIAKKMEITINQTRNILYKISDFGLVSSVRKKDKKKGWYTYFWKFEIAKCLDFLKNKLLEAKTQYQEEIQKRKTLVYYYCDLCNLEYGEDEALLMDFTCDECGDIFKTLDNSKLVKELERNLKRIEEKLEIIEVEVEKENKRFDRSKQLMLKREEKEKELKKEEARKKRAAKKAEKERLLGKTKKKIVKKKTVKKKVSKKKVAKKKIVKKKTVKKKTTKKKVAKKKVVNKKSISKKKVEKKKVAKKKSVSKKKTSKKKK